MFGRLFGSSKNVQENIGICPESLISYLGIIKTHTTNKYIKKPKTSKTSPNIVAVFWALLDPVLGSLAGPSLAVVRACKIFWKIGGRPSML